MYRNVPLLLGPSVLPLLPGPSSRAGAAPDCQAPRELIEDDPKLPVTAARLHAKEPLTIVVIGGASTAGKAAGNGEASGYPHQLEVALAERHKESRITVINKGVARQTTADMIERFTADV